MNILAHLHLASFANSSLLGNGIADFVKGNPYKVYASHIADGIMLHRQIDAYTDSTDEVKRATKLFREGYRRVAAITLDIVWDHFLSKNWHQYHPTCTLLSFNSQTQADIEPQLAGKPEGFQNLMRYVWKTNLFERYADLAVIANLLISIGKRHSKLIKIVNTIDDIIDNYDQLAQLFELLYPKLVYFAVKKRTYC